MSKQKLIFKVRDYFTYYVLYPNSTRAKEIHKAGTLLELDHPDQDKQAHKLIPIDSNALEVLQKNDEECGCNDAEIIVPQRVKEVEDTDALSSSNVFQKSVPTEPAQIEIEESPSEKIEVEEEEPEAVKLVKASARNKLSKGIRKRKGN